MSLLSRFRELLKPDKPVVLDARYAIGSRDDRALLDSQIQGLQRTVAELLARGVVATYLLGVVDLNPGDVVCVAPAHIEEGLGENVIRSCTLATSANVSASGIAIGVVLAASKANNWAIVAPSASN